MEEVKEKGGTPEYTTYNRCRFCDSSDITEIINFGELALAGGFEKDREDKGKSKKYPVRLYLCNECLIVSVKDIIRGDILFKNYYYSSSVSSTLKTHFKGLSNVIGDILGGVGTVLEIGCNDGILLNQIPETYRRIGVDPSSVAKRYAESIKSTDHNKNDTEGGSKDGRNVIIYNTYFDEKLGNILKGQSDLVTSSNCMAHIEDMNSVMRGVVKCLKDNGILIIEVHSLKVLIEQMNWDMIYSEHMTYYSVTSLSKLLERYGLNVYDAEEIPLHGGSIRVYAKKGGKEWGLEDKKSSRLIKMYEEEVKLANPEYYDMFSEKIHKNGEKLVNLLVELKKQGKIVIPYGASGRANTIMGVYNLTRELLGDFIIDDSPLKQGMYTPWNGLEIVRGDALNILKNVDYILLFAWTYKAEILKKYSGYKIINPITAGVEEYI